MDITYIPMERGFVYFAVVLDGFSRRVLSWRVSITMEAAFCVETLEDALERHGKPESFNTDQGSQLTGAAFTGVLSAHGIAISMDGKGAWRDGLFHGETLFRDACPALRGCYPRARFQAGARLFMPPVTLGWANLRTLVFKWHTSADSTPRIRFHDQPNSFRLSSMCMMRNTGPRARAQPACRNKRETRTVFRRTLTT
jgi:transposase InsO family protein